LVPDSPLKQRFILETVRQQAGDEGRSRPVAAVQHLEHVGEREDRVGRKSLYPEEFRLRAAGMVINSRRSVRDVANEVGVNHETLRHWIRAALRSREDEVSF
jgi:hypothetical protein